MTVMIEFTLAYSLVLLAVATGGMISEKSGVLNLGLEGIMVIGALAGSIVLDVIDSTNPWVVIPATIGASIIAGVLYSLILAVSAITFGADQTLVGLAMNMFAIAASSVFVCNYNRTINPTNLSSIIDYSDKRHLVFIGDQNSFSFSGYSIVIIIAFIIIAILIKKTRFGLRLIASGEHPRAVDSAGVSVSKIRYICVMISGAMAGLGGLAYITSSVGQWDFKYGVSGIGFLAIAVIIFGRWKPIPILISSFAFGCLRSLANVYSGIDFLKNLGLPSAFYNILPYAICLLFLAIFSKNSNSPKAVGIPYSKNKLIE